MAPDTNIRWLPSTLLATPPGGPQSQYRWPPEALILIKAIQAGYSVLFDTATGWVARLAAAHTAGRLDLELKRLRKYKLLIIDEIGYLAFDHDAANLFFQLVAARYEQGAILATSNMPFGRWGEIFSNEIVAAAMIDRLVHHAEVVTLAGDSYRTRSRRELLEQQPRPGAN